jgi:hypothetical protein
MFECSKVQGIVFAHFLLQVHPEITVFFSGLSTPFFRFSPLVEHWLQNFPWNQTTGQLPVLQVDAKTPNPNETPDLMKVQIFSHYNLANPPV